MPLRAGPPLRAITYVGRSASLIARGENMSEAHPMKSIRLHVYDDTGLESRMQGAFDLARALGLHITCLQCPPLLVTS